MPTRSQLEDGIIAAHNAGDFEAATMLGGMVSGGDYTDELTSLGRAKAFATDIPRGFLSSFATGAEGLAQLADTATDFVGLENLLDSDDDNEIIRLAREGQQKINETFEVDPAYRNLSTTK